MTGNHTFAVVLEHKYDEALNNLVIILRKKPQKTNKATEFIQNAFFLIDKYRICLWRYSYYLRTVSWLSAFSDGYHSDVRTCLVHFDPVWIVDNQFFDVILKSARQYLDRKIVAPKLTKWHQSNFHDRIHRYNVLIGLRIVGNCSWKTREGEK